MSLSAFTTGFALGLSLIVAIGAQNVFLLRHALMRRHVFALVCFCALSDVFLIALGVGGLSFFAADFTQRHEAALFGLAALWLAGYGALRLRAAFRGDVPETGGDDAADLKRTLATAAVITFGNPHVYLDTVVLIGAVSLQFDGADRWAYGVGAGVSSVVFFVGLGCGASLLSPWMQSRTAWRFLDGGAAVVMFALAYGMAHSGGWV